jgi:hypothetical protein
MKYILIIAIVFICVSFGRQPAGQCKITQRYYLHGRLVEEKTYETIAKDYGCVNSYLINGRNIKSDSVVTTLK